MPGSTRATTWTTVSAADALPPKASLDIGRIAPSDETAIGVELAYLEAGRGDQPTVVWIHGVPRNAYLWRGCLEPLAAAGYRSVAPDLLGLGDSTGPQAADYSPHAQARYLAHLLDALPTGDWRLVGEGLGATVCMALTLLQPDRVRGLVLLDPVLGQLPLLSLRGPASLARAGHGGAVLWTWALRKRLDRLHAANGMHRGKRDLYLRPVLARRESRARAERLLASIRSDDVRRIHESFRRISVPPTLVCLGPTRGRGRSVREMDLPQSHSVRLAETPVKVVERDPGPLLDLLLPFLDTLK